VYTLNISEALVATRYIGNFFAVNELASFNILLYTHAQWYGYVHELK
jgi:hypothetical protein